ncbi:MAG TPA: PAS domain S-box protein [Ignavibacteriales bacterium]|nr:PAS domain S-box protein [Ignavibacteriales bacterium]
MEIRNRQYPLINERKNKTIEKMEEERKNLLHALDSSKEGIVLVDENEKMTYYNQAFADLFGYGYEELGSKSWKDLVKPEVITAWEALFKEVLLKQQPEAFSREFELLKKDGTPVIIEVRATVRYDGNEGQKGFICFLNDISEKKKNEYHLSMLNRAIEDSGEVVFMVDEKGIFSYINPEFFRLYGYSAEELIGRRTPLIIRSGISTREELDNVLLKMKNHEIYRGNWATRTKDGRLIYMSFSASPYMNGHGEFAGYIVMGRDVTEKIKTRDALKASERFLSDIINSLPEPTFVINKDHHVIIWNKAMESFTGVNAEEVVLKGNYAHSNAIFGEKRPMTADLLLEPGTAYENLYRNFQRFENTLIAEINTRIPSKSEEVYLWSIASKLYDSSGNLIGAIQTLRDISGLKKIEQELRLTKDRAEELNRLKSNFIASMSHELRTPLVGILGFSEILLSEIEDGEMRQKVKIIFDSGKRLMDTLQGILDFSKLETNRFEVHAEDVNLKEVVGEIIEIYEPAVREKNLSLRLDIRDKEIVTKLDKSILLQALKNILSNALKYTVKGGIVVSVFKELNEKNLPWASISVKDTGIGISPENQKLIFEPFRQVSEGFNRKYEGTGLGLSLAQKFVELLRGKISFVSKEGEGTVVKISLPMPEDEKPPVEPEANGLSSSADEYCSDENIAGNVFADKEQESLVLFVEDDLVSQTVMKLFLKGLCSVESASSGEKALGMTRNKQYSAILMDMNLGGGLNGLETTAAIREIPGYETIPVIAVTAYATAGERERILSQGCDYYLSKPFTRLDITGLIKQVLKI